VQSDLNPEDWRILGFHKGKQAVPSLRIERELSIDHRKVLESLHALHAEGLVYFSGHLVAGANETIVSKITEKGIRALDREEK